MVDYGERPNQEFLRIFFLLRVRSGVECNPRSFDWLDQLAGG